jgi:hypothetical protein
MKREANLAPSTSRYFHAALARGFGWGIRNHPQSLVERGFATYKERAYLSYCSRNWRCCGDGTMLYVASNVADN